MHVGEHHTFQMELCKRFAKDTSLAEPAIKEILDILAQGRREKIYRDETKAKHEKEERERKMSIKDGKSCTLNR